MSQDGDLVVSPPQAPRADPKGAGPLLRTGAFAIDASLVGLSCWMWTIAVWRLMPVQAHWLSIVGLFAIVVAYYGWAAARNYHTIGQGFAGLTLARVDYQPLTPRRAYARTLIFMLTSGMALPNLIIMLIDKRRRTIHDFATKTWVFELPGFDARRRAVARMAGVLLLVVLSARALLAWADSMEARTPLNLIQIGRGEDGALSAGGAPPR